jgi:hypothetical protein
MMPSYWVRAKLGGAEVRRLTFGDENLNRPGQALRNSRLRVDKPGLNARAE